MTGMGQNWLYLLVKAFKSDSFSEQATKVIQYDNLCDLQNLFGISINQRKHIFNRSSRWGEVGRFPVFLWNCVNTGLQGF